MILDHYGFVNLIKLQKKHHRQGKMLRSLTIKLQLQLRCPNTRVFRRRLSAVELRQDSQSTILNG